MTTLDTFIDQCWSDHADDPAGVAARMDQALPLVRDEDGVSRIAMLAHHVFGEHLGRWHEGLRLLDAVAAVAVRLGTGQQALDRCAASLRLCAGLADERQALAASDACRVTVMAACSLAPHDPDRSSRYLEEAATVAAGLHDEDAGVRSLAAFSNNIAGTLQEQEGLDDVQRRLMLRAAEVARASWQRAGTWREVERAEYRLSVCCSAAGDGRRAVEHAKRCDEIVRANGSEPLEAFFAAESLALAAMRIQDPALLGAALRTAEATFAGIDPSDQGWCRPTLDKLRAFAQADVRGGGR